MIGQVIVDGSGSDRAGPDERERRERIRMVESSDLRDHSADADTGQMGGSLVEGPSECGRIGGEVSQSVIR